MIFNWFVKHILLIRRFMWLFILEYTSLKWVLEFEIEKLKLSNIFKRLSTLVNPLKTASRHNIGSTEIVENSKLVALLLHIRECFFHIVMGFYARVLLFSVNYIFKHFTFIYTFRFFKIMLCHSNNTLTWFKSYNNYLSIEHCGNGVIRDKLNILGFNSSWVHKNLKIQNTKILFSAILLDSKATLIEFVRMYFGTIFRNKISSIKSLYKYTQFVYVIVICLITSCIFKSFFYFNFFKNSWLIISVTIFLYFLISTYFHFSKAYQYVKYTSQTQRFWKRTFGIFWGLEFTLFSIYLYFTLVSPAELPMYSINYKEITTGLNIAKLSNYHIIYFTLLILLNFLYINLIILKKRNSFHFFNIVLLIINLVYCYILYYEFLKIYYASGWGTHSLYNNIKSFTTVFEYNVIFDESDCSNFKNLMYFKVPNTAINNWNEVQYEKQWVRTFRHFLYIIVILKFWHIFFIYVYFGLSLVKFLETNYWSFDVLSSNYQNTLYIIWFYLFSYILVVKKKIYFLITFVYFWSYVQLNFTNFIMSIVNETNIIYIL